MDGVTNSGRAAVAGRPDVAIVGAGLAGLMAAQALVTAGRTVVVLESGAQVGGRLATRSIGPGRADVGAQFFTIRSPEFDAWAQRWLAEDLAFVWSQGWSDGSLDAAPSAGHPRYAVRGGMAALAAHLAAGLDVRLNTRATAVTLARSGWRVHDQRLQTITARALLLTPPVPQALDLLLTGSVPLARADADVLESVRYDPCLAGLFWIDGRLQLPEPGAVQRPNAPITWIADNRRKGISPEAGLITVHAGPSYSRDVWSMPDWEALVALENSLRLYKDLHAHVVERYLVRWPLAAPIAAQPGAYLLAEGLPPLAFAGDAFGGARMEGAARSGLAAAAALDAALS